MALIQISATCEDEALEAFAKKEKACLVKHGRNYVWTQEMRTNSADLVITLVAIGLLEQRESRSPAVLGQRDTEGAGQGSDRLLAFERGTFSLINELNGLGEGGIPDLREQLSSDNKECSEKIKRLLHQHYRAFISASKVTVFLVCASDITSP